MRACAETVRLAVWADTTRPDSMGQERGLSRKATFKGLSTHVEADDADSIDLNYGVSIANGIVVDVAGLAGHFPNSPCFSIDFVNVSYLVVFTCHLAVTVTAGKSVRVVPSRGTVNEIESDPALAGVTVAVIAVFSPATILIVPSTAAIAGVALVRSGPSAFHPMVTCVAFPTGSAVRPSGRETVSTGCWTVTGKVTKLPSLRFRTIGIGFVLLVDVKIDTGKLESVGCPVAFAVTPAGAELTTAPVNPVLCSAMVVVVPSMTDPSAAPVLGGIPVGVAVTLIRALKAGSSFPTIVISPKIVFT